MRWLSLALVGLGLHGCAQRADLPFELTTVSPSSAHNEAVAPLTFGGGPFHVRGSQAIGSDERVVVDAGFRAWIGEVELTEVTRLSDVALAGNLPAGLAPGTYPVRVQGPFGGGVTLPDAFTVRTRLPAALAAEFGPVPAALSVGQALTLRLRATNTGDFPADAVGPVGFGVIGPGVLAQESGPTPATQPLQGQQTAEILWQLRASAPGTVAFRAQLTGTDASSGAALSSPVAQTAPSLIQTRATLSAAVNAPAVVAAGEPFEVTVTLSNWGEAMALGVIPSLACQGPVSFILASGPDPAVADVALGTPATVRFVVEPLSGGRLGCELSAVGVDANDRAEVKSAPVTRRVEIADEPLELPPIALDPFNDGTPRISIAQLGAHLYLGINRTGRGGARMNPDGTGAASVGWILWGDINALGTTTRRGLGPFGSIGFPGCSQATSCGPDGEDGIGFLHGGTANGTPYLSLANGRSLGDPHYLHYETTGGTSLGFTPLDLVREVGAPVTSTRKGVVTHHAFNDRAYLGGSDSGGSGPYAMVIRTGVDSYDLDAAQMPGIGVDNAGGDTRPSAVEAIWDFQDRVYLANHGGCLRSTVIAPRRYGSGAADWASCTPSAAAYSAKTSLRTDKPFDLAPADRAIPQFATFQGALFMGRNTVDGPQLFRCDPAATGAAVGCDPGDWTLIAANSAGDPLLTQFDNPRNTRLSLLLATATRLYLGFDNDTDGVQLFRTTVANPDQRAAWSGRADCDASLGQASCPGFGGNGLAFRARRSQIFDARPLVFGTDRFGYFSVGGGTEAAWVYRVE